MRKGVVLVILFGLIFLLSAGCGEETPRPEQSFEPSEALLSADLFSWMINFDGYEVRFPTTVSEFTWATGTQSEASLKEEIRQHSTGMTYINTSDGHKMNVYFYADADSDSIPLGDCMLSEIIIDSYDAKVIFPKGLTFDSTREDVILAYGEPTEVKNDNVLIYIDPEFTGPPAPYQHGAAPAIEFEFRLYPDDEERVEFITAVKYTGMTA